MPTLFLTEKIRLTQLRQIPNRLQQKEMVLKIVDSFQMFRVIVISFVCVRQSLKIEKRKNWIKLKLRYFTGAHVIPKTDQGGASYSLGNRQLQTFHLSARRKTEFK